MPLAKPCRRSRSRCPPPPPPLCQLGVACMGKASVACRHRHLFLPVRRLLPMALRLLLALLSHAKRGRSQPLGRAILRPRHPSLLLPANARVIGRRSRCRSSPSLPSVRRRLIKPSMVQSGTARRPWRNVTTPSSRLRRRASVYQRVSGRVSVSSLSQHAQPSQRLAQMARGTWGTPASRSSHSTVVPQWRTKPTHPTSYPGLLKLSIPRCRGGGRMGRT